MSSDEHRPRHVRVLSGALAVALVVAVAGIVYLSLVPPPLEPGLTELSLLGPNGTASDYPTDLRAGESGAVTVVVENRERREMTYTLLVRTDETTLQTRTVTLEQGGTWREEVTVTVQSEATSRIEFALYEGRAPDATADPYRVTYLTLDAADTA